MKEKKSKINVSHEPRYRNINQPKKFSKPAVNKLNIFIKQKPAAQKIFIYPML